MLKDVTLEVHIGVNGADAEDDVAEVLVLDVLDRLVLLDSVYFIQIRGWWDHLLLHLLELFGKVFLVMVFFLDGDLIQQFRVITLDVYLF